MAVFRLQEHVPDVYARKSRDFQLLCNVFDCMNNAVKYDIDSIRDVTDTNLCNDRLLNLLQTKLGFFTNKHMNSDTQRIILKAFPYMIKNKGSTKGIKQAIYTFLKTQGVNGVVTVQVINRENVNKMVDNKSVNTIANTYVVELGMQTRVLDTTILTEILKYIIPAGYIVRYSFNNEQKVSDITSSTDYINIIFVRESLNSGLRLSAYNESDLPINSVDTVTITNKDTTEDTAIVESYNYEDVKYNNGNLYTQQEVGNNYAD